MERKFSEHEQGQIFTRAIELQREAGHELTLSQMESTALEAGIDPRYLRAAVEQLQQGNPHTGAAMLPRWRAAALCAVVVAQIYTMSGQLLLSERDFYLPIGFAAVVGAVFAGRSFLQSLKTFLVVSAVTALITTGFILLGAAPGQLAVATRQALFTMLVQSLLFTAGHFVASALIKRENSLTDPLRIRLVAAQTLVDQVTNDKEILVDRHQG